MFRGIFERAAQSLEAVKRQLSTSANFRSVLAEGSLKCVGVQPCFDLDALRSAPPEPVEWKIIDHCSAVTRIYAVYEQFAHTMIREFLAFQEKNFTFLELRPELRDNYRIGLGRLLQAKDAARYRDVSLDDVVREFDAALSGKAEYRLEAAAMLMQEQNLRFPELQRIFRNIGVDGVSEWIDKHPDMIAFFNDESRVAANADGELQRLIDYRNEAAHGGIAVDDVAGIDTLCELSDFAVLLCCVLAERVQNGILHDAQTKGKATLCGKVENSLKGGSVVIAPVVGHFAVGQSVYLRSDRYCVERRVVSIQLKGIDQKSISLADEAHLGFGLDGRGKVGADLLTLQS